MTSDALPILVVSPEGSHSARPLFVLSSPACRVLIGRSNSDGIATFELGETRETALRCRGFYVTPGTSHVVPGVVMRMPD